MSAVYNIGEWLFKMMILTILWVFTLTLTLGTGIAPATVAVYSVCLKMIKDIEMVSIGKDFISCFKAEFKKLIILSIASIMFIYFSWFYYINRDSGSLTAYNYGIIGFIRIVLVFILVATLMYIFPMIAYFKAPLKKIVVSSFLISTHYLIITLLIFALIAAIFLVTKLTKGFLIIFSVGIYCYLSMLLLKNVFKKHCQ